MQTIREGVASLSLIAYLNIDRAVACGVIGLALFVASYVVTS